MVKRTPPPLATEHALQSTLLEYLDLMTRKTARRSVWWFAIPNAGKRSRAVGAWLKAEGLTAGVADLCFMLPGGKCAWLELKRSPREKQSSAQGYFEGVCSALGHPYAVAHSFDEAVAILQGWGVLPPSKEKSR